MNWPKVALKSICTFGPQYGANVKAVAESGLGVRYVRITDIDEYGQLRPNSYSEPEGGVQAEYLLEEGDLLFARSGATVGKTYKYSDRDGQCLFAGYLIRFKPNHHLVSSDYLGYYVQSPEYWAWVQSKKRVAAQPNINGAEYASLEIPLASFKEQSRIVELLDEADRLRRLRREADAKATRILPALFLKMFGDPATNPMGWPQRTLSEFGAKARYGLGQPPKQSNSGLALIRATNIDAGRIVEKNLIFVDKEDVPPGKNAFLASEEVIVVRSGVYTGDVAQVTEKWAGSVAGYDLVVTPAAGWSGEFIEQYLLTPFVQRTYFDSQKGRAGQPHINSTQLEATPAFNPPESLQIAFAAQVRAIRSLRDECINNAERLEQTFNVLLQCAFSGQLTAQWREAHIQELLAEMAQQARSLNLPIPQELETLP